MKELLKEYYYQLELVHCDLLLIGVVSHRQCAIQTSFKKCFLMLALTLDFVLYLYEESVCIPN